MRCAACAQAITGQPAEYRVGCLGCSARAIVTTHPHLLAVAMDDAAPRVERQRAGDELRAAIAMAMHGWGYEAASAEVKVWWRIEKGQQ